MNLNDQLIFSVCDFVFLIVPTLLYLGSMLAIAAGLIARFVVRRLDRAPRNPEPSRVFFDPDCNKEITNA